jgi:hypothetical protein
MNTTPDKTCRECGCAMRGKLIRKERLGKSAALYRYTCACGYEETLNTSAINGTLSVIEYINAFENRKQTMEQKLAAKTAYWGDV